LLESATKEKINMIKYKNILKETALKEMTEGHVDSKVLHRGMNFNFVIPVLKACRIWDKNDQGPEYERWVSLTTEASATDKFGDCAIGWNYKTLDQKNDFIVVEYDVDFFKSNPEIANYVGTSEDYAEIQETLSEYLDEYGGAMLQQSAEHEIDLHKNDLRNWKTYEENFDDMKKDLIFTHNPTTINKKQLMTGFLNERGIDYGKDDPETIYNYYLLLAFLEDPNLSWLEAYEYYDGESISGEPFSILQSDIAQAKDRAVEDAAENFSEEHEVIARNGFKFKYSDICYVMVRTIEEENEIIKEFPFLEGWVYHTGEITTNEREELPDEFPKTPIKNYHDRQVHFPFFKRGTEEEDD